MKAGPIIERFENLIEYIPGFTCWAWMGRCDKGGYGRITKTNNEHGYIAHRLSYELYRGGIPDGYDIHHLCKNKWCVNPNHLEPISKREHMILDNPIIALNANKSHCINGHEFNYQNTIIRTFDKGRHPHRRCNVCVMERGKRYYSIKKEKLSMLRNL